MFDQIYRGHRIVPVSNHAADIQDQDGHWVNRNPVPMHAAVDYIDRQVSRGVARVISDLAIFAQEG